MLPYDLVPEALAPLVAANGSAAVHSPLTAAAAAAAAAAALPLSLSQESGGGSPGRGNGGNGDAGGSAVLVMTSAEGGQNASHSLMVIKHLEALVRLPQLRPILAKLLASNAQSTASAAAGSDHLSEDHCRQYACFRLLVNQQLAARFELRIGCHLIRQVLLLLRRPGPSQPQHPPQREEAGEDAVPPLLHLAELLLDHDRPQRWRARERECQDRVAQASLEELEDLAFAWCVRLSVCLFSYLLCLHPRPPSSCLILSMPRTHARTD